MSEVKIRMETHKLTLHCRNNDNHSTLILQFGGNDADREIEIHDFNRNYLNIIQEIQKCNEVKHIVVGGVVPRTKKNTI
jgi:lysophospholipase L1-like esterase